MSDCRKTSLSASTNTTLMKDSDDNTDEHVNVPYREAIGALTYLAQSTRPDIAFAVNAVARFCEKPRNSHWTAVKKIFRYLQGTVNDKLKFTKNSESIVGYCDSDHAGDKNGEKDKKDRSHSTSRKQREEKIEETRTETSLVK
jgi:hypothetical protein